MKKLFEILLKDVGKDFDGTIVIKHCENNDSALFIIIEARQRRDNKIYSIIKGVTKKEISNHPDLESFLKDVLRHVIKDVKELCYIF